MVTSQNKVTEIKLYGELITVTNFQRHLGVILAANMKWDNTLTLCFHVLGVCSVS